MTVMADAHTVPFSKVGPEGGDPALMLAEYGTPADVLASETVRIAYLGTESIPEEVS